VTKQSSLIFKFVTLVLCVGTTGCITAGKKSAEKPEEEVSLHQQEEVVMLSMVAPDEYTEDFVSLPRGVLIGVATDILVEVGHYLFSREAELVGGAYKAKVRNPQGIILRAFEDQDSNTIFIRDLHQTLVLDRFVGNKRAMSLVIDLVPFFPENSSKSYFQIKPRSFRCDISRAKSSKSLLGRKIQFEKINISVLVTVKFPDARQPSGSAEYEYSFEMEDYEFGEMEVFRENDNPQNFVSDHFEVPSDGPMSVMIKVIESNSLDESLEFISEQIEDL